MRLLALAWTGVAALAVGGCSTAEYYWQGISGQLDLLGRAQPIAEVLDATRDPGVKRKLERVLAIREYASRELGLPEAFVGRHPFPGPGLAIRCPGEITREKLDILRRADAVYIEEIRRAGLYDDIWQAFAVILPVKTVGVMGDYRTYDYVVGLRAVTSTDGMTADFYPFDMKFIGHVATRIVNEVKGVNRVVYDVTSKPPGTIEWE